MLLWYGNLNTVLGNPAPDLKWWKDGSEIADDDNHVIHVLLSHGQTLSLMEFWYQLTIINVTVSAGISLPSLISRSFM